MIKINYPDKKPSIKNDSQRELIFCVIRKRWILLTPEEWVRQNFLLYLIEVLMYPASLVAVEKQLMLGELKRRFDILVYDRNGQPFMIVECKEMNIALSESTLQQVLRYNMDVMAKYIVVTNGNYCMAFLHEKESFTEIHKMPERNDLPLAR